jgi:PAS domain S-box-containing protein
MAEKNRSMAIVKSISDPLVVMDAGWRIQLVNDACAEFFGLEESRVAGRHFLEAIHDGELFETVETLANAEDGHGKVVCIRKGGEHYFNLIAKRLNDPDARNAGFIVAFQNVTGLKELERVRTDFLATISHEFKTPLTSIMMAASMLGEGGMGGLNAEQADAVQTIREDGDTLLGLVNELLELMKIESGKDVYRFEPCSAKEIVSASVETFLDVAARKGVLLSYDAPGSLPDVLADFEKIRWVVNNLVGNALKATEKGGTVAVTAERRDRLVLVSVQDTGEGIPPEYLDRIFDKFVQVEGRDVEVRGTGLGLTVSREIVRDHGGDIHVESVMGTGSTFTFTVPVAGLTSGGHGETPQP